MCYMAWGSLCGAPRAHDGQLYIQYTAEAHGGCDAAGVPVGHGRVLPSAAALWRVALERRFWVNRPTHANPSYFTLPIQWN